MVDTEGAVAVRELIGKGLSTRVLLTMHREEAFVVPLLEAGAAGYLDKSAADSELVDAVRAVARGDRYVKPTVTRLSTQGLA
jgi:DNA-binding NarL/FixJ family response regulator